MTRVHLMPEPLGAPVRLEEREAIDPGLPPDDLVLVGVQVVGCWIEYDRLCHARESEGRQCVVMVEQCDELASGLARHQLRAAGDSKLLRRMDDVKAFDRMSLADSASPQRFSLVPVVDEEELPIVKRL